MEQMKLRAGRDLLNIDCLDFRNSVDEPFDTRLVKSAKGDLNELAPNYALLTHSYTEGKADGDDVPVGVDSDCNADYFLPSLMVYVA